MMQNIMLQSQRCKYNLSLVCDKECVDMNNTNSGVDDAEHNASITEVQVQFVFSL